MNILSNSPASVYAENGVEMSVNAAVNGSEPMDVSPVKDANVIQQMKILGLAIENLDETLSKLRGRLHIVLLPDPPSTGAETTLQKSMSPHADELYGYVLHVRNIERQLVNIIDELDI